jgi:hypothetical protein
MSSTAAPTSNNPACDTPSPTLADTAPANAAPADTGHAELDQAIVELVAGKERWLTVSIADRRAILAEMRRDFGRVMPRWAEAMRAAERLPANTPMAGEEWLVGPYLIVRNLALLDDALADIERFGQPRIPGPVTQRPDGRTVAQVFPARLYDRLFYTGVTSEVWMQPGVTPSSLPETQAVAYRNPAQTGQICLVLGAGNVSSIGPMDAFYKLFVDNQVVLYKNHPLNAYLGPLMAEAFQALIDWDALRLVYGGVEVGSYLTEHPDIDEIHITGSDRTVEAIVFGAGEEGRLRKEQRRPRNTKPISSELGNVSPVIVVPGPWSNSDLDFQAENLAATLTNNAGFNCNASRVVVTHREWTQRPALLDRLRAKLAATPTRHAYFPGAHDRYNTFHTAHPEAERFGQPSEGELPWTLIPGLDPAAEDEICYRTEAFCGVFAETAIEAPSAAAFVDQATAFANDRLWGTLNVTLLVHPASLRDKATAAAVERAVADLRYGTVAINIWAAAGFALVITPWGAYPGHDLYDIQSGTGIVHNTLMFSAVEKTVIRAPFRMRPKPIWFPSHQTADTLARALSYFELSPSVFKLPSIFWPALRG